MWGGREIMTPARQGWIRQKSGANVLPKVAPKPTYTSKAKCKAGRVLCFLCWPSISLELHRPDPTQALWTEPASASSPEAEKRTRGTSSSMCCAVFVCCPPPCSLPPSFSLLITLMVYIHPQLVSQKSCRGTPPTVFPSPHSPARASFSKSSMP